MTAATTNGEAVEAVEEAVADAAEMTGLVEVDATYSPWQQPDFTKRQLTSVEWARALDRDATWRVTGTSDDFGQRKPFHGCITATPADPDAAHRWVREFSTTRQDRPTAALQVLEVSKGPARAARAYDRLVLDLAACPGGSYEVRSFASIRGLGDEATLVRLGHVQRGAISEDKVVLVRTGRAVVAWVVEAPSQHPVSGRALLGVTRQTVLDVCGYADGRCADRTTQQQPVVPPAAPGTAGFVSAVDLPLFAELPHPWVATNPEQTRDNPAATECDQADFVAAGAKQVRTRSFVVPTAENVDAIFGMSETVGEFSSPGQALEFVLDVKHAVATCSDRQLNVEVTGSRPVSAPKGTADIWELEVSTSDNAAVTFKMALMRRDTSVAQLTFTPTARLDIADGRYDALTRRALERLSQP
jgi:hypothetical protein